MESCAAHSGIKSTVDTINTLLQKTSEEVSESNVRMAVVELRVSDLKEEYHAMREENERHQTALTENINRLYLLIEKQSEARRRNTWRPVHTVTILSSVFGSAAVVAAAWITAKVKGVAP